MQQPEGEKAHVLVTPLWVFVTRIFQILISLAILGLAADLAHDAYLDEEGLALAVSLITWIVTLYAILTERLPTLYQLYHVVAIIVLDGVMMILWLATFAAVAARRAQFVFNVSVQGCFNDGSLFNSETCYKKRDIGKRDVILFKRGGDMLSAIAGLGALVWLLFIATFAWTLHNFLKGRKEGRFLFDNETATPQTIAMETKHDTQAQQQAQQQTPLQPQPAAHQTAQYPPQEQYQQGQYPPQTTSPYPPAQSPYQPQATYSPPPQEHQQAAYGQYPPQQYPPQGYHEAPSEVSSTHPHQQPPYQTS
ncbi:uncharacterized protein TrAtP1_006745 [Trichoderma atroviride]|uniref:MARVEL domain-containing protein n=1 Tax=Hypocrea atroviridis (strain ATCC 20476 / IMI 206040) TaxID=452589 RepID=G9PBJ5_HYPAI|nr:uncharacterized protein TRIATDRAFT_133200 [Trichoderma atroviride IMI 206040]EHK39739.1 hypothetical protein TRIATDRAFT_133200 [Trichoderma atroviride IMI 206040]UKZ65545.1 hypothetical protein TrAtP1_006745 [Trichoderma atroviride]